MATRPRKRSAPRGQTPRRAPVRGGSSEHGGSAREPGRPPSPEQNAFGGLADVLDQILQMGHGHPLGQLGLLFLLQALEWQSAALDIYQRVLREGLLDVPAEEQARTIARSAMSAYLEFVKSAPERRERLLAGQAELARSLSAAVEDLRRRLATPTA